MVSKKLAMNLESRNMSSKKCESPVVARTCDNASKKGLITNQCLARS